MRRVVAGLCVLVVVWACSSDDDAGGDGGGEAGAGGEPAGNGGAPSGRSEGGFGPLQLAEPCLTNQPYQCAEGLGCTPNGMSAGVDFAGYCRTQCRFETECEGEERCIGAL